MMFSFFFIIELVRMLYEQFQLAGYSLSCFILIALWFSLPRAALKKVMNERVEQGQF